MSVIVGTNMIDQFDHAFILCSIGLYLGTKISGYIADKEIEKLKRLTKWRDEIKEYHGW